jgi:hypothetical protein
MNPVLKFTLFCCLTVGAGMVHAESQPIRNACEDGSFELAGSQVFEIDCSSYQDSVVKVQILSAQSTPEATGLVLNIDKKMLRFNIRNGKGQILFKWKVTIEPATTSTDRLVQVV